MYKGEKNNEDKAGGRSENFEDNTYIGILIEHVYAYDLAIICGWREYPLAPMIPTAL